MEVDPPHLAQVGALPIVEKATVLIRSVQEVARVARGEKLMGEALERCELIGATVSGSVRHHGFGIPLQNADRVLDRADAGKTFFQRR